MDLRAPSGRQRAEEEFHRYVVVGAGPAGLQLSYYLSRADCDYVTLERDRRPGSFFRTFPRHRQLISLNKVHTLSTDPEIRLRWDWNSLLSAEWSDPLPWEKALEVGAYTLNERGRLKPEYREVFRMIADRGVMVSFGHATHREIYAMAEEVQRLGITRAVVDHPFSPFLDLSQEQMRELTSAGIYLNFTYDEISPLLGINPAVMCQTIQDLGTEHVTLSSDAGELFPNTVEALRLLLAHMRAFGLTEAEVHQTSVVNPARLVGAVLPGAGGAVLDLNQ